MNSEGELSKIRCRRKSLGAFVVTRGIVGALCRELPRFEGVLLDVGCGRMPYKTLITSPPSRVTNYIGLDLHDNGYQQPDIEWDGKTIPLPSESIDCAMATEVFEHCQDIESVLREIRRVMKPGGFFIFTVPFLWPLHCIPHDEYRYTPFAMERHLLHAGFKDVNITALGGWDASMAQMIALYVSLRPMSRLLRSVLSWMALPIVFLLGRRDRVHPRWDINSMPIGLSGTATK